jgi:hypothetical protein
MFVITPQDAVDMGVALPSLIGRVADYGFIVRDRVKIISKSHIATVPPGQIAA